MIQRIQSIYLVLVIVLSLLLLNGSIMTFSDPAGKDAILTSAGKLSELNGKLISQVTGSWMLISLLSLIALLSLVSIFLFRKRTIQMKLTIAVLTLGAILIAVCSWLALAVIHDYNMMLKAGLKMAFPVLILLFSILAFLGIRKDERLVKSYDRLR